MKKTMIGKGGSACVYRIWREEKGYFVIEKKSRDPLIWEAIWLKKLQGFSVPQFYAIRKQGSDWILEMEYLPGMTLEQLIGEETMDEQRFFSIMCNLILELIQIREYYPEMVFCDLKPSNIIVERYDRVKLIDFDAVSKIGIKKRCRGTRPYAAPEIFEGNPGLKSDIYSIGQMIWQFKRWKRDPFFFLIIFPCIRKDSRKRQGSFVKLLKKIKRYQKKLQFVCVLKRIWKCILFVFFVLWIVIWLLGENHDIINVTKVV